MNTEINFKKGFKNIFWGLLLIVFSLDLFNLFGISAKYLMEIAGVVFINLGLVHLTKTSKWFKLTQIFSFVFGVAICGVAIYEGFFASIPEYDVLIEEGAKEIIELDSYITAYIETGLIFVCSALQFLMMLFFTLGIKEYTDRYCNSLNDESHKRFYSLRIWGIAFVVAAVITILSNIQIYNAYNALVANGGVEFGADGSIINGQEAYDQYFADTLKGGWLSLLAVVGDIGYLISMIKLISFTNRLANIMPLDSYVNGQRPEPYIDVEAKEKESFDDWKNDF